MNMHMNPCTASRVLPYALQQCTLQKNDGYFNPYVRLSQLHLSIPGTIECAECVGDLLSNEAIEQLRIRELQVD